MEEKEPGLSGTGRLAESIHPEIGNEAFWENTPHFANLRMADPGKALESLLYTPEELERLVHEKLRDINSLVTEEDVERKEVRKKVKPKHKKKKDKKSHSEISPGESQVEKEEFLVPEFAVRYEPFAQHPTAESASSDIDPTAENTVAEGKRVKKVIKAVEGESEKQVQQSAPSELSTESSLSPYTFWLKSLRGSEYVHPYNDDYALDQHSNSTKGGISETFAELLAGQGYREQAIEMYKLLMARFPEKSSFFAAKIETLK